MYGRESNTLAVTHGSVGVGMVLQDQQRLTDPSGAANDVPNDTRSQGSSSEGENFHIMMITK